MKRRTARIVAVSITWVASLWATASCASSEDDLFPAEAVGGGVGDAASDVSAEAAGGTSGFGAGGSSGSSGSFGVGGTGGSGAGGTGGSTAGTGGASGTGGTSGSSAGGSSGTGGTSGGSCNPAFCPSSFGTPCCITPNGPCGCDMGGGCMSCGGPGGS